MAEVLAFVCLFLLISVFLATRENGRKQKAIENAFADREILSPERFHDRYFADIPKPIVFGVREVLEQYLDTDLSRVQDRDDFSENLQFFWDFDSMADIEIVMALEKRFGIHIEDSEAEEAKSVRDIVLLIQRKLTDQNTQS